VRSPQREWRRRCYYDLPRMRWRPQLATPGAVEGAVLDHPGVGADIRDSGRCVLLDILVVEQFKEKCLDIILTKRFEANWAYVEMWHALGLLILEEYAKPDHLPEGVVTATVAELTHRSERTVRYAVAFAREWPDLNLFPGDTRTTWKDITQKMLPEAHKPVPDPIQIPERATSQSQAALVKPGGIICPNCGYQFGAQGG